MCKTDVKILQEAGRKRTKTTKKHEPDDTMLRGCKLTFCENRLCTTEFTGARDDCVDACVTCLTVGNVPVGISRR